MAAFKHDRRLTHAREFDAVFAAPRFRASSGMFLVLARDNEGGPSRIGTVVSLRVAGNAVNRNRIRRIIKESFRRTFVDDSLDLVVVARDKAGRSENLALHGAIEALWNQIREQRAKA